MRVYLGGSSRPFLRRCRRAAPSLSFGRVWTPDDPGRRGAPFIVDCGAFGGTFDPDEWTELLDLAAAGPIRPDFVVVPDVFGDSRATARRSREFVGEIHERNLVAAWVLQPPESVGEQLDRAERHDCSVAFVGGPDRWQQSHQEQAISAAHDRGLHVHVGNPGTPDGFARARRQGADSVDSSTPPQSSGVEPLRRADRATMHAETTAQTTLPTDD